MNRLLQAVQRNLVPAVGVLIFASMTTSGAQAADCDRACLKSMITKYVDAMVAHDPSRLPLAKDARFTEDSQELKLGEGLWKTVTKRGDFRQDYIDLKKQIAASHVMLFEEERAGVSLRVRLRRSYTQWFSESPIRRSRGSRRWWIASRRLRASSRIRWTIRCQG